VNSGAQRNGSKIVARGLTKTFQSARGAAVDALGPLDIEIGIGEFLAVVGPSG
jgi:ABC-type lipoprotein export system ATPase subunit